MRRSDVWFHVLSSLKRESLVAACYDARFLDLSKLAEAEAAAGLKRKKSMRREDALSLLGATLNDAEPFLRDPEALCRSVPASALAPKGLVQERPWWFASLEAGSWILEPLEVTAFGYFREVLQPESFFQGSLDRLMTVLAKPDRNVGRQHLIRHYRWWRHADHLNQLDELVGLAHMGRVPAEWPGLKGPTAMLRAYTEREATVRLAMKNRHLDFSWLDSLQPPCGPLRILRSAGDCTDCGRLLHNCAGIYGPRVAKKQCILVALDDISVASDFVKPLALGEFRDGQGWTQISATCNRSPLPEHRQIFDDFTNDLQAWWSHYKTERRSIAAKKSRCNKRKDVATSPSSSETYSNNCVLSSSSIRASS